MLDLEGRIDSVWLLWPDAAAKKKTDIALFGVNYNAAIEHRNATGQNVRNKRAARDAAKEAFITKYAAIISRVEAKFPRDKAMIPILIHSHRAS